MEPSPTYLDPKTLARIKDLELKARSVIEGFVSGAHKSPFQGVSVEFAEHREYVPGDDVRHIDWKVFGKTDKYYLKQYEQETNLVANLLLDTSESMAYASAATSKLWYASQAVAAIGYLVLHQQDSVGLTLFDSEIRSHLPPSGQMSRLRQMLKLLAEAEPAEHAGRIGAVLDDLAGRLRKRSLVLIVSDAFDTLDTIVGGLKHLRHKRHEVVWLHVLDPAELDFPFQDVTLFRGLEGLTNVLVEPKGLRKAYQEEFGRFVKELRGACRAANVDYQLLRTDQPLDLVLASFLSNRSVKSA